MPQIILASRYTKRVSQVYLLLGRSAGVVGQISVRSTSSHSIILKVVDAVMRFRLAACYMHNNHHRITLAVIFFSLHPSLHDRSCSWRRLREKRCSKRGSAMVHLPFSSNTTTKAPPVTTAAALVVVMVEAEKKLTRS